MYTYASYIYIYICMIYYNYIHRGSMRGYSYLGWASPNFYHLTNHWLHKQTLGLWRFILLLGSFRIYTLLYIYIHIYFQTWRSLFHFIDFKMDFVVKDYFINGDLSRLVNQTVAIRRICVHLKNELVVLPKFTISVEPISWIYGFSDSSPMEL